MDELPVIELEDFLTHGAGAEELCKRVAAVLRNTGCLIVRDPRVDVQQRDRFVDMMQQYFALPLAQKEEHMRPEVAYQVGCTPEKTEVPRDHSAVLAQLKGTPNEAVTSCEQGRASDPKWRFFWRIGERVPSSNFPEDSAAPVIPKQFPQWEATMNQWGAHMLATVKTVAEMLATGLGLDPASVTSLMEGGSHLLAPTGSDLSKYGKKGTVFAGFHYDMGLLTIHGKSNFPGLFVWLRDGTRVRVKVPDGCLLLQAGKQLEWLTGGIIKAGWHEVVVADATIEKIESVRAAPGFGDASLWRVSSTMFTQVAADNTLSPLLASPTAAEYSPIKAGAQIRKELQAINLMGSS